MENKSKHLRLLTDFGFKKMFGEENKEFLIALLNACVSQYTGVIEDITYLNVEQLGNKPNEKKMVFDIYCKGIDGKHFIVELQVEGQSYYGERALTYLSRIISKEAIKGDEEYKIPPVYIINLLNFNMPIFNDKNEYFWVVELKNQKNELFLPKVKLFFIELRKFARLNKNFKFTNDLQRWLYLIKNMGDKELEDCPFEGQIFKDLFEKSEIEKLTPMELENYEKSIWEYKDVQDSIAFARECALKEGIAEGEARGEARGEAKGEANAKLAMAKAMLLKGIDIKMVMSITGLTEEKIKA